MTMHATDAARSGRNGDTPAAGVGGDTNSPRAMTMVSKLRPDLQVIADLISPSTKVLDLGCAEGDLLEYIIEHKQVRGRGIEISEAGVLVCMSKGLSVRQGNLQEGLADYPSDSMDTVVLSQTLPFLDDPAMVIRDMLRVGKRAIVSLPNWGHWRCRVELMVTGRIPHAADLPQAWYEVPRWQAFTITDFGLFCRQIGVNIRHEVYLAQGRRLQAPRFKNLMATTAIFGLELAD